MFTAAHSARTALCRLLPCCLLIVLLSSPAWTQQSDAETIKLLLQRVQDLEGQVSTLRSQVEGLAAKDTANSAGGVAPAETSAAQAGSEGDTLSSHLDHLGNAPRLQLRGYGDVGWSASNQRGSTNSFALGQLNLFITSRLTDKISFLAETVIEADSETNEFGIEPERLELIYGINERINLAFGRYHTGIGYYNTAYHHSALMQTAIGRPFLFEFEDEGGILPIHNVGISATGTVSSGLGLHYIAEIGNGRSARTGSNPVQNVTDDNNGKSFNLGFFVRPEHFHGLQFGFSGYHDHVTPTGQTGIGENIFAAHVVYQSTRFEFLNEALWLRHTLDHGGAIANIPGFYSQISRRMGNFRPYFRYEYVNVPARDPLYSAVGLLHGPSAGVRYDLSEFAAFKIQYGRNWRRNVAPVNTLATQLSFAF